MTSASPVSATVLDLLAAGEISAEAAVVLLDADAGARLPEVAILGASVRLPGIRNPEELWDALVAGRSLITQFPLDRFDLVSKANPELHRQFHALRGGISSDPRSIGGWLGDIDRFSPEAFGMTAFEAEFLGPPERMVLELAQEALSASGHSRTTVRGSRTGIFLAYQPDRAFSYLRLFLEPDERAFLSHVPANAAYQVAYNMDLHGPVLNVDTTCSSSLTALHLARRSLQLGECDLAVVAGISLNLFPFEHDDSGSFVRSGSRACHAYDARADGVVWGEGGVALVLKRKPEALKDRDPVLGVIAGSALASDGFSNGLMAPNPTTHRDVVRAALAEAGFSAESLGYVEGHGAGTALGDVVEVDALTRAFRLDTNRRHFCQLGSVKTITGHLGDAAGLAGVLATLLRMQHRALPPLAGLQEPNPGIAWDTSPFVTARDLAPWAPPDDGRPRRAGVSSLGLSGTVVHVVLEEHLAQACEPSVDGDVAVLLSADSRWAVWELVRLTAQQLDPGTSLAGVAYTLARRDLGAARIAIRASTTADLVEKLERLLAVRAFDRVPEHFYEQGIYIADLPETAAVSLARLQGQQENERADDRSALLTEFLSGADVDALQACSVGDASSVPLPPAPFTTRRIWPVTDDRDLVDVSQLFFQADWAPTRSLPRGQAPLGGTVLVFAQEQQGWVRHLKGRLEELGASVVVVRPGAAFQEEPDGDIILAPDAGQHYEQLWDVLSHRGLVLRGIIHAFSYGSEDTMTDLSTLRRGQSEGVHSLFHLGKQLARDAFSEPVLLTVVTAPGQEVVVGEEYDPARVTAFGLARVLSQELPKVGELSIDHDLQADPRLLAEDIVREFAAEPQDRLPLVAYRGGVRYMKQVQRSPEGGGSMLKVRQGGVYVVVGGTGYLGPQVARMLADQGAGTVVLLSRHGLPDRQDWAQVQVSGPVDLAARLSGLEQAEQSGARVVSLQCDITDPYAVKETFERITLDVGPVRGGYMLAKQLFHLWVADLDAEQFHEGIDNRVRGTWLLAEQLKAAGADFLVLFSSISSMSGTKGAGECAAVNQYLDALGPYLGRRGLPTFALNLPLVLNDKAKFAASTATPPIDFTEFRAVVARLMRDAHPLNLVARLDLNEVDYLRPVLRIPFAPALWAEAADHARRSQRPAGEVAMPDLAVTASSDDLRRALVGAWRSALGGGEPVGDDHFFALGGSSLSALRFVATLKKAVPKAVFDVPDLFAHPTFAAQLQVLDGEAKAAHRDELDDVDAILLQVESGALVAGEAADLLSSRREDNA